MKIGSEKKGFSLTEMVVVVAIVALLTALGIPAIHSLQKSFESGSGVKASIDAALSAARAIAAKEQRYAGVRFELDFHDHQYMIFIIHDPEKTNLSNGFRALEGQKPIKLPDDVRVIDKMLIRTPNSDSAWDCTLEFRFPTGSSFDAAYSVLPVAADGQVAIMRDMSCFSIIFSPAGKLVFHEVRVRNRDGIYKPDNSVPGKISMDDIFNSPENILNFNVGMFLQDDGFPGYYAPGTGGLGPEISRNKFYIYEKSHLEKLTKLTEKYNYIESLKPVFINEYTGTIVNNK